MKYQYSQNIQSFSKQDSSALSQKRELFEERQEVVDMHFEFDCETAYQYFHALPLKVLPPLPRGHQWIWQAGIYSIIKDKHAPNHEFTFVLYGPGFDPTPYINFLCLVDNKLAYSLAKTKSNNHPGKCHFPVTGNNFHVLGFDYNQPRMFKNHVRGHAIDHQDTIIRAGFANSSMDTRNYLPEPPFRGWGLDFRNKKIKQLRDNGGGYYSQINDYDEANIRTVSGIAVPTHIRLNTFDANFNQIDIHHVSCTENLTRPTGIKDTYVEYYKSHKSSSLACAPVVQYYDPIASDRDLRTSCRQLFIRSQNIGKPSYQSRFIARDTAVAASEAGNVEFETKDRLVNSTVKLFDIQQVSGSISEMRRSLRHVNGLSELTTDYEYDGASKQAASQFFAKAKQSSNPMLAQVDIDGLEDEFKQYCNVD